MQTYHPYHNQIPNPKALLCAPAKFSVDFKLKSRATTIAKLSQSPNTKLTFLKNDAFYSQNRNPKMNDTHAISSQSMRAHLSMFYAQSIMLQYQN